MRTDTTKGFSVKKREFYHSLWKPFLFLLTRRANKQTTLHNSTGGSGGAARATVDSCCSNIGGSEVKSATSVSD